MDTSELYKFREILLSDEWPIAVDPALICDINSYNDKLDRAVGIVESMIRNKLTSKSKLLDFGCGEGHCVAVASDITNCGLVVGYDIKSYKWEAHKQSHNMKFTTSYEEIKHYGPYDAILLFDVIDHIVGTTQEEILNNINDLLSEDGEVYLRCHPWMSRHGSHMYYSINKAYIHLFFTENELIELSYNVPTDIIKITSPITAYSNMFTRSGFKIDSQKNTRGIVEPFFKTPEISNRIINNTKSEKFPELEMQLQFIDYTLTKFGYYLV